VSSEGEWSLESFLNTIGEANKLRNKLKNEIEKNNNNELLIQLQEELIKTSENVLKGIQELEKLTETSPYSDTDKQYVTDIAVNFQSHYNKDKTRLEELKEIQNETSNIDQEQSSNSIQALNINRSHTSTELKPETEDIKTRKYKIMFNSVNLFTFDGNPSKMSEWIVRLENNFKLEKIDTDDMKISFALVNTVHGSSAYKVVSNYLSSDGNKTWKGLVDQLQKTVDKVFDFDVRNDLLRLRQKGSLQNYISRLTQLKETVKECPDSIAANIFINGISDEKLRINLFTKYYKLKDIKLVNLLEDAIQMDREIQELSSIHNRNKFNAKGSERFEKYQKDNKNEKFKNEKITNDKPKNEVNQNDKTKTVKSIINSI
jgi:hypothetical protein